MRRRAFSAFACPRSPISIPVSLKYVGTAELMHPIANPVRSRPAMSWPTENDDAWTMAPKTATRLPSRIVPWRPIRKVNGIMGKAVTQAARLYDAVIIGIVHTPVGLPMASREGGYNKTPPNTPASYCKDISKGQNRHEENTNPHTS